MRKIYSLFIIAVFVSISASSQLAIQWQKTYGGSGNDQVGDDSNYYDAPDQAVIKTSDGGYLMIGFTASADGAFPVNLGGYDFAVVKTDSAGDVEWSNTYGTSDNDMATSVVQTSDGGYAIAGFTSSSSEEVMLIKIDATGNLLWQTTFGGSSSDRAYSLGLANDGGFYIGATSASDDSDHVSPARGDKDYWLIRTDSAGVLLWEKSYGGASYDWLNSIKVTTDGGVIMCGFVYNNGGDITVNIGAIDIWIVKTDTSGNIEWEKSYGGTGNDWGFAITQSSDGGYAFAALTESNDSMVTGWHGGHDYWIVKLDSAGNLQWQKALGGAMVDECYDILETPDNGYLIAGTTNSDDGDLVQNYGLLDFNVMKVNSSGDFEWSETYGGTLTDWGMSIIADGNGDYILAGSSKSSDIDMTSNAGGWDLCLLKLTSSFNTIKGKYFYDNNNNLVFDSGDLPVTNQMVSDTGGNLISFTNINGDYRMITVDTGTFVIEPRSLNYYSTLPASHTINFPVVGQIDSLNDFSAVIIPGIYDLNVNIIPLNRFRPGFNVSYLITYSNIGTEPVNGRIVMILDTNLIYTSASITPDTVNGDTLIWSSLTLAIQESGQITVNSILDPLTLIGTNILTDAAINTPAGITDEDSLNNYSSWADDVTGSYDPNDKAVSISKIYTNQLPNVPFLDYLIRFQNTGNDTAFTVVVRDTMSQLLDMSTFATINSSHTVEIDYQPLSRVLAFTFSNILLADSNVNEPMSHGFIHFKVKPITNLVDGDEIENTAGIYFDFNPPVITNTAVTQILLPTRINQISDFKFGLYPNPSIGKVTVTLGENYINKKALIQIVNSLGEIVYSKSEALSKNKIDLNTSDLATGLYIVRVVIDDKTSSKQFIKQ